ncbi:ribosomal-protein-alanine N-acetyltransferase [Methanofollis sp. W23]|uniref:ribosomal protein S18-alanine N-acetyltransferase n=1 Tax=Methanofollis sp. W23 TaxID=2817849 RepID=UPI001AE7156B|nr:ribosomal protein S18-alanine N-acetyltransferase [Methanofollis sp. W23]MBP2146943.1 ribosomal-protein-alanine N-acetyltransferase [Methanofollis sp. W23]
MSETRVFLRRAVVADLPTVAAIERESFVDPWSEETFLQALEVWADMFFVAQVGNEIAGFIVGGLEDTGDAIYGHVCNFAVTRTYQGHGIGRLLLRRAEHQFAIRLAEGVQLEVRVSNTHAQSFYQKNGYQPVFVVAGYYANGEDAILMMKWFF